MPRLAWADDPNHIHNLDELAARQGAKPYSLLEHNGRYASERTVFEDTATGAQLWRITHEPGNDMHAYYDIPAWNCDGSVMMITHGSRRGSKTWILAADCSWLRPLEPQGGLHVNPQWSWIDPRWVYFLDREGLQRADWTTGQKRRLVDPAKLTGIQSKQFRLEVPHPADDRLLFDTRSAGRLFVVNADGTGFREIPTDGRWATDDAIHRCRWTKSDDFQVFMGQNHRLAEGKPTPERRQMLLTLDGKSTDVSFYKQRLIRGDHPDTTSDGQWTTGTYEEPLGSVWKIARDGSQQSLRCILVTGAAHHSSNSWDNRWHVADNAHWKSPGQLRGQTFTDSIALASLDGRAQAILCYHYSSYGPEENTHPAPVTSPDGTKVCYNSDMLKRGQKRRSDGNADVWVAVLRRPFPPRDVVTEAAGGKISLRWQRPLYAEQPLSWNPGNLSREIKGYCVLRGDRSGGPYSQVHDGVITDTSLVDVTAQPGRPYYYVVQLIEHSGLASLWSAEVCATTDGTAWQGPVRHYYQAEYGRLSLPMVPQMDWRGASGGWCAGTFAQQPDPRYPLESYPAKVALAVTAPKAGAYSIWVRASGFSRRGRLAIAVDGKEAGSLQVREDAWHWSRLASPQPLQPGRHEIVFSTAEPSIGLDMICLTDDPVLTPIGLGNWDTQAPARPQQLVVEKIDATTRRIRWAASTERDFSHYNVYCGRDGSFPLTNSRRVLSPTEPQVIDWGVPGDWATVYKVTAVDRCGNESEPATADSP